MIEGIDATAARVHDLIPHEYELSTHRDMQELIRQCKYEGAYEFDSVWDTLTKAFECGYAMGHLATLEGKYKERMKAPPEEGN